jgi:hypothetical protein
MQFAAAYQGSAMVPQSIQAITGGVLAEGTGVTQLTAPGVQFVGSAQSSPSNQNSLTIENNALVSAVNFPALTAIAGSLVFASNPVMNSINGFPQLMTVGGNVDLTGDFQSVSLQDLTSVGGGVNIQSSNPNFECPIGADRTNGVVKGKGFVCAGNIPSPTPGVTGANFSANTFSPSPSGTSGGASMFQSGILGVFFEF